MQTRPRTGASIIPSGLLEYGKLYTLAQLTSLGVQPNGTYAYTSDQGLAVSDGAAWNAAGGSVTIEVASSRDLTGADNGKTLECTVADLTLTVPTGLGANFGCAVIPNGTTSVASSGGTLLNGATDTLTRAAASNALFAIVPKVSADSYVVTGS